MENALRGDDKALLDSDGVFENLDRSSMLTLLNRVADLSLVVDTDGRIVDLAVGSEDLEADVDNQWVGQNLADTVTDSSRSKIEDMLALAASSGVSSRWQDVIHQRPDGSELPISYFAVAADSSDQFVVVGRDLRAVAQLRQQLVNAQIALERDYWRLRQVETRYRLVFQMVEEAVLVIDDASGKILEANQAASRILGHKEASIVGKSLVSMVDQAGADRLQELIAETRVVGRGSCDAVKPGKQDGELLVSANLLKQENESRLLLRLSSTGEDAAARAPQQGASLPLDQVFGSAPDAILVTGENGRVVAANQRFVDLAEVVNDEQAIGQSLEKWFGRSAVDANVLLSHLRRGEAVSLFATTLNGEQGTATDVEVSTVALADGESSFLVFFVRDVSRRLSAEDPEETRLPRSVAAITQQVGRVPLKSLVRQSTDVVEKLCIEAALKLTGDNRASAAELLGLSRQSLYSKLRRHNLGDIGPDESS